jgi:tripeptidyl-peptidase-1
VRVAKLYLQAQAENVVIYYEGSATSVGGTSCSSPIFAAIIGLINDQLAAAGKSPLGESHACQRFL